MPRSARSTVTWTPRRRLRQCCRGRGIDAHIQALCGACKGVEVRPVPNPRRGGASLAPSRAHSLLHLADYISLKHAGRRPEPPGAVSSRTVPSPQLVAPYWWPACAPGRAQTAGDAVAGAARRPSCRRWRLAAAGADAATSLACAPCRLALGYLYPAYKTFKVVQLPATRSNDMLLRHWCQYW